MSEQKTKHTPGPWQVTLNSAGCFVERFGVTKKCEHVDAAALLCDELNAKERIRDAAPALLAACKRALACCCDQNSEDGLMLQAAIAQAEGADQ